MCLVVVDKTTRSSLSIGLVPVSHRVALRLRRPSARPPSTRWRLPGRHSDRGRPGMPKAEAIVATGALSVLSRWESRNDWRPAVGLGGPLDRSRGAGRCGPAFATSHTSGVVVAARTRGRCRCYPLVARSEAQPPYLCRSCYCLSTRIAVDGGWPGPPGSQGSIASGHRGRRPDGRPS